MSRSPSPSTSATLIDARQPGEPADGRRRDLRAVRPRSRPVSEVLPDARGSGGAGGRCSCRRSRAGCRRGRRHRRRRPRPCSPLRRRAEALRASRPASTGAARDRGTPRTATDDDRAHGRTRPRSGAAVHDVAALTSSLRVLRIGHCAPQRIRQRVSLSVEGHCRVRTRVHRTRHETANVSWRWRWGAARPRWSVRSHASSARRVRCVSRRRRGGAAARRLRAKRVLEMFLYGGLSPWETLYFVRNYGTPTDPQYANTQYYTFATSNDAHAHTLRRRRVRDRSHVRQRRDRRERRARPVRESAVDRAATSSIACGIVVQKHKLEPHEAAVPQALTGRPVGQPTAAASARTSSARGIDAGRRPSRASPYSYVFATGGISSDNVAAAAAAGTHPGARASAAHQDRQRGAASRSLLERSTGRRGSRARTTRSSTRTVEQYDSRLTWPGERPRAQRAHRRLRRSRSTTTKQRRRDRGVLDGDLFASQAGSVVRHERRRATSRSSGLVGGARSCSRTRPSPRRTCASATPASTRPRAAAATTRTPTTRATPRATSTTCCQSLLGDHQRARRDRPEEADRSTTR